MADAPLTWEELRPLMVAVMEADNTGCHLRGTSNWAAAIAKAVVAQIPRSVSDNGSCGVEMSDKPSPPVAAPPATLDEVRDLLITTMHVLSFGQFQGAAQRDAEALSQACQELLSAQPQPQPAQPLTDEQCVELYSEWDVGLMDDEAYAVIRAIERAHGITAPSTPTPPEVAP